eukprot:Opistho-2@24472
MAESVANGAVDAGTASAPSPAPDAPTAGASVVAGVSASASGAVANGAGGPSSGGAWKGERGHAGRGGYRGGNGQGSHGHAAGHYGHVQHRPPMGYGMYPMGVGMPHMYPVPMPYGARPPWGPGGHVRGQRGGAHAPRPPMPMHGGAVHPGQAQGHPHGHGDARDAQSPVASSVGISGIKTNLYIAGLPPTTTDEKLGALCTPYGEVVSAKAILDRTSGQCKGYGFVMLDSPATTAKAVAGLKVAGYIVSFAKDQNGVAPSNPPQPLQSNGQRPKAAGDSDPTNLYFSNLPRHMDETQLEAMIAPFAKPVSTRILRDSSGFARGVGFARMDSPDVCEQIIANFNGVYLPGCLDALQVRLADTPGDRRQRPSQQLHSQHNQHHRHQPQPYWGAPPGAFYQRAEGSDDARGAQIAPSSGVYDRSIDLGAHAHQGGMLPPALLGGDGGHPRMHPQAYMGGPYPPGNSAIMSQFFPQQDALAAEMGGMRIGERPTGGTDEAAVAGKV